MNRSLVILLGALVLSAALLGGSYAVSRRVCENCMSGSVSDLDWLQQEFHLGAAEMARIQKAARRLPAEVCRDVRQNRRQKSGT